MAITLDTIVNKVFKVVKNGYDNNEVEAFLDEILEEMENREAQTNQLKEQVAALTRELELDDYTIRTYQRTVELWDSLGTILEKYLVKWKIDRISRVALVILRLALCEMRCDDSVPTGAAINEAVELAKKYSSEEDAAFINGVLGAAARAGEDSEPVSL